MLVSIIMKKKSEREKKVNVKSYNFERICRFVISRNQSGFKDVLEANEFFLLAMRTLALFWDECLVLVRAL